MHAPLIAALSLLPPGAQAPPVEPPARAPLVGAATPVPQGTGAAPTEAGPAQESAAHEGRWIDPEDGWFDLSRFLEHPAGFLPLVVPITEPALGYGAVVAAAFLDPREEAGSEGWARPDVSVIGGLATEDGSDGLFAANSSLWSDGDLQTLVGVGRLGLELGLYGIGDDPALAGGSLEYALDVDGAVAEVRARVGDTPVWGGLRFAYARAVADFEGAPDPIEGVGDEDDDVRLAGPALTLRYDSLDNLFTPTRGTLSDTSVSVFDDAFGGSQDFQLFQQVLIHHQPLSDELFLGARGLFSSSFGDTPFYARPFVQLRGVPALRYQGEQAASVEVELRWQLHRRVGLVGFGGVGWAWTDLEELEREQSAAAGGVGVRYLVARRFGLHAGIDVAHGPEDGAIYVQFGNAWLRP